MRRSASATRTLPRGTRYRRSGPRRLGAFLAAITRNISVSRLRERRSAKRGGGEYAAALDELAETLADRNGAPEAAVELARACAGGERLPRWAFRRGEEDIHVQVLASGISRGDGADARLHAGEGQDHAVPHTAAAARISDGGGIAVNGKTTLDAALLMDAIGYADGGYIQELVNELGKKRGGAHVRRIRTLSTLLAAVLIMAALTATAFAAARYFGIFDFLSGRRALPGGARELIETDITPAVQADEGFPLECEAKEALADGRSLRVVAELRAREAGKYLLVPQDAAAEDSAESAGLCRERQHRGLCAR